MNNPPSMIITNATVIDGTSAAPHDGWAVAIKDGRVHSVGPMSAMSDMPTEAVINAGGRTIIPGMIDLHTHWYSDRDLAAYVQQGITSVRFAGVSQTAIDSVRTRLAAREIVGPRLFSSGRMIDLEPPAWEEWGVGIASTEDAKRVTTDLIQADAVNCILVAQRLDKQLVTAVIEASHQLERPVVGQIWRTDGKEAAMAGIDQLDNTSRIFVSDVYPTKRLMAFATISERLALFAGAWATVNWSKTEEIMAAMLAEDVAFCPTIVTLQISWPEVDGQLRRQPGFSTAYGPDENWSHETLLRNTQGPWGHDDRENLRRAVEHIFQWCDTFRRRGGRLLAGTDTHFAGFAFHREIENLRTCGMSPSDVLTSVTSKAAKAMAVDDVGEIAPGKWADLVILNGDPLADTSQLSNIDAVFVGGTRVAGTRHAELTEPRGHLRPDSKGE